MCVDLASKLVLKFTRLMVYTAMTASAYDIRTLEVVGKGVVEERRLPKAESCGPPGHCDLTGCMTHNYLSR